MMNAYPHRVKNPRKPELDLYVKNTAALRIPTNQFETGLSAVGEAIQRLRPKVVIALGDTGLWATTGERGITKWRGSLLEQSDGQGLEYTVIPTFAPDAVLRKWDWRSQAVHDLRRARRQVDERTREPNYNFRIRPDFGGAVQELQRLVGIAHESPEGFKLSVDIETRNGHIACIGFGWSRTDALCIPLMCVDNPEGYWSYEEEYQIVNAINRLLCHPNLRIIGQNFLYDLQYLARHWGIAPFPSMDTMLAHAVCFPGTPKGLDYLSSMYCEYHRYWKDESKDWDPKVGEDQLWTYNCKDCVVTYEVSEVLESVIDQLGLREPYQFEMDLVEPLFCMMLRGVRINTKLRGELMWELQSVMGQREEYFEALIPDIQLAKSKTAKPWYRSPQQLQKLFYEVFGQAVIRQRKTGRPTIDDDALTKIGKREPLLYPLTSVLSEYRSLGVFLSTFIQAPLDHDHRMRCSYNPVGTETFRFNSSADAFGYGTNLQNIPKGDG
jgi:DNA polymerase I-like protein with 3'-5' exonuclease and polymerase domains